MPFESPLGVMSLPRLRATRERARVRRHIAGAARKARGRAIALDRLPMLNRLLLLDELAIYRRGGQFPINRESRRVPVPVFVDEYGTRCAVGHLMEVSGQGPLVQHIARTRNNARVRELAALPEMRAWLAAAGLSLDEAARIQPTYCFLTEAEACFCHLGAAEAVAVGTLVSADARLVLRIDRIEGERKTARVGDQIPADSSGQAGQQVFLLYHEGQNISSASELTIRGDQVYCQVNPDTARRPVTIDTAIDAMLSEGAACVEVLANDDSLWNRSQCEGGSGLGTVGDDGESDSSSGGCGLAPPSFAAAELTSVALFAALWARRRRRPR